MKRSVILISIVLMLSGCAKIAHLPQLLTLKGASDNRTLQKQQITRERASFEKVLAAYKNSTLNNYPDQTSVLKEFGEPLLIRETERNGLHVTRWLYRDPLKSFESEKVYLYFDDAEKLTEWEYVQPKPKAPPVPAVGTQS